jgi:hypothetical protein
LARSHASTRKEILSNDWLRDYRLQILLWLIMQDTTTATLHCCNILINLIIVIIYGEARMVNLGLRVILAVRIVGDIGSHGVCRVLTIIE